MKPRKNWLRRWSHPKFKDVYFQVVDVKPSGEWSVIWWNTRGWMLATDTLRLSEEKKHELIPIANDDIGDSDEY